MQPIANEEELRSLYESYTTEYLQELGEGGSLTDSALKILLSELASRGASPKAKTKSHEPTSTSEPKRKFNWLLSRIRTIEEARKVVKGAAYLYLIVGTFLVLVDIASLFFSNAGGFTTNRLLIIGTVHALLALWLLIYESRVAAILLFLGLVSSVINDLVLHITPLTGPQLFSTWISYRAILATWKLSRK